MTSQENAVLENLRKTAKERDLTDAEKQQLKSLEEKEKKSE